MFKNFTSLAPALQTIFTEVADELARDVNLVKRKRKLTGSVLAQTLVFGWLDKPMATLEELADFAMAAGVDVSPQAIDQRITPAAVDFFEALLCRALEYSCQVPCKDMPLLKRFNGVYAFDTTDISLPASMAKFFVGLGGSTPDASPAACSIQYCVELSEQGIVDLQLAGIRRNDLCYDLAHASLPVGSLLLNDLGFFNLDRLNNYDSEGVYYISRWKPGMLVCGSDKVPSKLIEYLEKTGQGVVDQWVSIGEKGVRTRLVAFRLAPELAKRRREKLLAQCRKKGKKVSPSKLAACDWDAAITNVPATMLTLEEVIRLRRLRWQQELLFKQFKSIGCIDKTSGEREDRVYVELLAKLIGQLVSSWQLLVSLGSMVSWSWYRGSKRVQGLWRDLVSQMGSLEGLVGWLVRVATRLKRGGKKKRQTRQPAAFQFAQDTADVDRWECDRFP
jgi:hypothetical protein